MPQPLTYLIDDVARRHGLLRVGSASSYLRCDDPAVLDELMAGRAGATLRLRRLAPTVVVTPTAPDVLLDRLRELGLAPAAEGGDGSVVVSRPDERRTGPRAVPARLTNDPPAADADRRRLDRSGTPRPPSVGRSRGPQTKGPGLGSQVPRTAMTETMEVLRQAVASGLVGVARATSTTTASPPSASSTR